MMSWSVPITVDSHLHRRSKKGDGCRKVDASEGKGVFAAVIARGMAALDESAVVDMVNGGRGEEQDSGGGRGRVWEWFRLPVTENPVRSDPTQERLLIGRSDLNDFGMKST
jgi:hypothetical protein